MPTKKQIDQRVYNDVAARVEELRELFDEDPEYLEVVRVILDKLDKAGSSIGGGVFISTPIGRVFGDDIYNEVHAGIITTFENDFIKNGPDAFMVRWEKLSQGSSKYDRDYSRRYANDLHSLIKYLKKVRSKVKKGAAAMVPDSKNLKASAEAPASAPLERIAFGDIRGDVPSEPNTELEDKVYEALYRYIENNKPIPAEFADVIRKIVRKGYYSKVFMLPASKTIYRGSLITEGGMRKLLKLKSGDEIPRKGSREGSFKITPKNGGAASWTTSLAVAKEFSTGYATARAPKGAIYQVVFIASTDDSKDLLDMSGLYSLGFGRDLKSEKEILALGPLKAFKMTWSNYE